MNVKRYTDYESVQSWHDCVCRGIWCYGKDTENTELEVTIEEYEDDCIVLVSDEHGSVSYEPVVIGNPYGIPTSVTGNPVWLDGEFIGRAEGRTDGEWILSRATILNEWEGR